VSQAKRVVKKGSSFPVSYAMAAAGGETKKAVNHPLPSVVRDTEAQRKNLTRKAFMLLCPLWGDGHTRQIPSPAVIFTPLMRGSAGWVTETESQLFLSQPIHPSALVVLCASVSQAKRVVKKGR
jgi:hypothetical protein